MTLRDTSGSGAAIESMVNYSNRLYDTMVQAGFTKDQAAALIGEMKLTPTDIYTTFRSNASEAELRAQDVRRSIEDVPGWKDIYFNAMTDAAKAAIAELSQIANEVGGSVLSGTAGAAIQQSQAAHGGRAMGGSVQRGVSYLVGERGPEIASFPSAGKITPAHKTKQMLGGTTVNAGSREFGAASVSVTIVESKDARATAREVIAAINRETRMGRSPLVGV